ncbi:MAG TPA: DUF1549 and DUF1553 domain-containing protein [Bryobacteraceae bacterium]|nr:DUF1549 and DUF1553 domain-containing protein [Bryobacteraceae bacterium]
MLYCFLFILLAASASAKTIELKIYPPEVRFHAGSEGQKVLVVATDEEGVSREVTSEVSFQVKGASVGTNHTVKGTQPGTGTLRASFDGLSAEVAVEVLKERPHELSFINDIVPIFTRTDCANSNCHGSIRGQKGFKLSLFGSDPDVDFDAITKNAEGKRIDKANPANSLVLRKPSFQEAHGGGQRFKVGSDDYNLLLDWLKRGTPYDAPGQARLRSLAVYPSNWRMVGVGSQVQLVAVGEYNDGSVRDLTSSVAFRSNIGAIASVKPGGLVTAEQSGETAVMARTLGRAAAVRVIVVKDRPLKDYPVVAENNFIDRYVFAKLRTVNVIPSPLSTDEEFLRRVYLDTVGAAPTIAEARAFLDSKDPKKRSKLIDQLLERTERADLWAMRFSDMYRAGYNEAGQKGGGQYGRWFRDQIRKDVPYDEMVRNMLVSQGRHDFEGVSNFYFVSREITPEESGVNVSQLLLGLQIECARCHNHPFEKWKQDDFYGFAAFFSRVGRKDMYLNNHNATYLKETGEVLHPKTKKPVTPKYLDGDFEPEAPGQDVREKLAKWVTAPNNPYFARASVNRFWKFIMGRGLVEQVDDFRVTNPPTNDELLDALAKEFVAGGYSIKKLERAVLNSRTYQLSSVPNGTNRDDQVNYSHFLVRRLMSEQIADTMAQVTGIPLKYPTQPLGKRAMSIPVLNFGKPDYMMKVFGRNDLREVICERDTKPSVAQVMHLVSGETIQKQITSKDGNLDAWLADSSVTDRQIVENIYLAALTRKPGEDEVAAALAPLASGDRSPEARRKTFEDLLWTAFNSKEFLFHH